MSYCDPQECTYELFTKVMTGQLVKCNTCYGRGFQYRSHGPKAECQVCGGSGYVTPQQSEANYPATVEEEK